MKRTSSIALGLALLAATAEAQRYEGDLVAERTEQVLETFRWEPSLAEAEATAARTGKAVFWMQLVGDLDGGL